MGQETDKGVKNDGYTYKYLGCDTDITSKSVSTEQHRLKKRYERKDKGERMEKKAEVLDWFYIIVLFFAIGISVFVGHMMINNTSLQNLFSDEGVTNVTDKSVQAVNSFDNIMLFVIVGLSLFVLISAALIHTHVAMFIIGLFLLAIAVTFSAIMSNAFWDFSNSAVMATTASAFPKITFLMNNLPLYIAFMGIAVAAVAYISWTKQ